MSNQINESLATVDQIIFLEVQFLDHTKWNNDCPLLISVGALPLSYNPPSLIFCVSAYVIPSVSTLKLVDNLWVQKFQPTAI